jgi:hypothetical protein
MKHWIELTEEYANTIKHLAKRKIRLQAFWNNREQWAMWDKSEKCFSWNQGEDGVYIDDPLEKPTHIQTG